MITLIARITAKQGEYDKMRGLALDMAKAVTANEPGNLLYCVTEGAGEGQIVLIERYRDDAALEAHRGADHFKAIGRQLGPTLAGPPEILFRLTDCV